MSFTASQMTALETPAFNSLGRVRRELDITTDLVNTGVSQVSILGLLFFLQQAMLFTASPMAVLYAPPFHVTHRYLLLFKKK